jgi:hypothetical protein
VTLDCSAPAATRPNRLIHAYVCIEINYKAAFNRFKGVGFISGCFVQPQSWRGVSDEQGGGGGLLEGFSVKN